MGNDEFTKLFQYMRNIGQKLDKQIETMATKDDINKILNRFDSIEKQLEVSEDERVVMGHQLDRLHRWTEELANKIGHKLSV